MFKLMHKKIFTTLCSTIFFYLNPYHLSLKIPLFPEVFSFLAKSVVNFCYISSGLLLFSKLKVTINWFTVNI